ncbi:peptidase [Paramagnetospirillum marisnigri]|uniref:Peptidase n=1 Tax=Paramagnetospirillum marisnigri TaxID=1285242 RepID=A0A178M7N1_9PROT|nr:proteasome-type protease [Paramagnetospirillum marisnigri]OAN44769.1 peptidase [Paramagnetospirillum marisnigri]
MSYCLGMRLKAGMVFVSDSRTNAGVDSVATFRKSFVFDGAPDRVIVILTAGNLAITQSVISLLEERLGSKAASRSLYKAKSMYDVARMVGQTLREVFEMDGAHLKSHGADFVASLIVGGQIKDRRMRLFNVYAAGNFIEATDETPYFQIGETKYGKPIIERVITPETSLEEAVKCALVSFDSTIKSNISVALPIDVVVVPADGCRASIRYRVTDEDPYFKSLRRTWGEGLRKIFSQLPEPEWVLNPTKD